MSRRGRAGKVVVFAKVPMEGRVKTRMSPPLSPRQAADLYGAMLGDVLEATVRFAESLLLEPVLALHPGSACAEWAHRVPPGYRVIAQRGGSLAERMANAVDDEAEPGGGPILLRGSDSPALPGKRLEAALLALEDHDIVLSPDRDGGYSLIGLGGAWPGLFAVPTSTGHVLTDTLCRAEALGARAALIEGGFDLDRIEDLSALRAVAEGPEAGLCARTLAYLEREQIWPPGFKPGAGPGGRAGN